MAFSAYQIESIVDKISVSMEKRVIKRESIRLADNSIFLDNALFV